MRIYIKLTLIVVLFFQISKGQNSSVNIDSLVSAKSFDFEKVYELLKPISRDSLAIVSLIEKSQNEDYFFGEAYALHLMGIHCRDISQYNKAIKYHKEALYISKSNEYIDLEVSSLNMLGVVYRRIDAMRTALDYHQEALVIAETITPKTRSTKKSIAVSLNSIGIIYLTLKQYELAIERFSKSIKIEDEVNNTLGLAINNSNIGIAKEGLGELNEAMYYYKKSLELNKVINSKLGIVICNSSIGTLLIKQNKEREAISLMEATLKDAEGLRDKFHLASIYTSLGWAYLNTKKTSKAKDYLNKSQELALKYNFKTNIESNYRYLASVAEEEKDYEQAFLYSKKSREYSDEFNEEQNLQYVSDIIIKYDTEKITDKIQLLENQQEIDKLKYRTNRNILFGSLGLLIFVIIIFYILYRQQALKNEKKIVTLEQDILRSQMNPHFLFNSLNSIKQYIITNDQKSAVYYLNKFAKLMRKILEASKTKEVSITEELETIQLYFSIENIRFSNEIDFKISRDDNINLSALKIPSLVLQPFIENSIWHGLSSKKGNKKIELNVSKPMSNHVKIKITDNGIGREKAAFIKKNKFLKRKSVGLTLTNERLTNFVKNYKNKFTLNFIDLKDEEGKAIGTEVVLNLPIK